MTCNQRDFRKDKPKPLNVRKISNIKNINNSLLEFIPYLMRGRDKL